MLLRNPRWLSVLIVFIAALAALAGGSTTVHSATTPINPRVVAVDPPPGTELAPNGTLTVNFNTAMDQATTQAAITVTDNNKGTALAGLTFNWTSDHALSISFGTPLARNAGYTLHFSDSAKSANGLPLAGTVTFKLQTIGDLQVTQIIPGDAATDITADAQITVIFNRPVVPLTSIAQQGSQVNPITISPAVQGTGEWLNTSIYVFHPHGQLVGGTTYTVTVKAGLTDLTGAVLAKDATVSFSTVAPQLTQLDVGNTPATDGTDIYTGAESARAVTITVGFSQPMDHTSTEQAFSVTKADGTKVTGAFAWAKDDKSFTFTPDKLLDYSGQYAAKLDPTIAKSANGAALQVAKDTKTNPATKYSTAIQVVDPPTLSIDPTTANGQTTASTDLNISFNVPLQNPDKFSDHVTFSPKPPAVTGTADYQGLSYNFHFGLDPLTQLTVTIDPAGLTDIYGTPLKADHSDPNYTVTADGKIQFTYTIQLAFNAELSLQTQQSYQNGNLGLYSAYAPQTRVYSLHRNIDSIDLGLWKIPSADVLTAIDGSRGSSSNYVPADTNYLRGWQVGVTNPDQAERYDLLTISATGPSTPLANSTAPSVTCDGAPASRLHLGDSAMVTRDDPTPLNVRKDAGTASPIVTRLPIGTQLTISAGPTCKDKYVWWGVTVKGIKNQIGWAAEGDMQHYFLAPVASGPKATATTSDATPTNVPTANPNSTTDTPLKPGAYFLSLSSPDLSSGNTITQTMIVATANITLKLYPTGATAWVTDLKSGLPVANVPIAFKLNLSQTNSGNQATPKSNDPGTVQTDANGLAVVSFPKLDSLSDATLLATLDDGTHFGIGSTNFTDGIDPYNFNLNTNYQPQTQTVYMYSDRSLYKPGQPVYFKGVVRAQNYNTFTLLQDKTISVEAFDDSNQSIYKKSLPLTPYGTFSDQITLAPDATLGNYRIVASLASTVANAHNNGGGADGERDFSVAEYTPPEYQVNVTADKPDVVQGGTIKVTVDSTYFFGGNVNGAQVDWTASTSDYYFNYTGSGSYNFIDYNDDAGPSDSSSNPFGQQIAQGTGTTDASGQFVITLPASLGKSSQSQQITVEATITDKSGQQVSGRIPVTVHAGLFYLGATPEDFVGQAGKPAKIDVIAVDWHSQPTPNTAVTVKTVERRWKSVQQVDPDTGSVTWNYTVQEIPVDSSSVTTDADGKAVYSFTPPHAGEYKVYVSGKDSQGNTVISSAFEYVAGPEYVPWRQTNDYSFTIKPDKQAYHSGDTASILIASPFQGNATAWVTVEGAGILKSEVIPVNSSSVVYKLPIATNFAPNVFVSVILVKGTDATSPIATFRVGMAQLTVDPEAYKLNITVTPDKKQAGPRQTVTYKVHVTDAQGKPVQAEVGIGLSDLATLSLLPDTSAPILDFFYNQQALSVLTASTLTISVDQQTQFIRSQVKGGGGGGAESGIFTVRQLFIDTPLWKPTVTTDANGDGSVSVTLPDQLTTWRLDARAVTLPTGSDNTTLVGQTTFDLISTKPLLIRPITPRFFTQGDHGTLAAIVNNNSGSDQQVTIKLDATGVTLGSPASQTVSIPNGQQVRIDWPVTIPADGKQVGATFYASTADNSLTDAAKSAVGQGADKTIPVFGYTAPETVATAGLIGKDGGNVVEGIVPSTATPLSGSIDLRVDPSLAAAMLGTLKATPADECGGCAEYTVSQILANVTAYHAIASLNVTDQAKLKADLDTRVQTGIQELYDWQRTDGGWAYYPISTYATESDPVMTAYALIGLATAQQDGYTIDHGVLNSAVKYLKGQIKPTTNLTDTWQLNRQAVILYALARANSVVPNSGNLSSAVNLFAVRTKLSLYARAELAMTIHLLNPTSTTQTDSLIADLQSGALTSASGEFFTEGYQDYWNWNSDIRTTAIALQALIEIQPTNALIPNVVRWLMAARSTALWQTSQETTWSISALSEWLAVSNELKPNYNFSAQVAGQSLISTTTIAASSVTTPITASAPLSALTAQGTTPLTISRTAGDGNLYYTLHLTQFLPADQIQAASRGITVSRAYSLTTDPKHTPITQATVGQNIQVTLTIVATQSLYDVTLHDPIPAGTEAINGNLATTAQVGTQPTLDPTDPFQYGFGWWYFDSVQFTDQQTVLSAVYLPAGTYQQTYVLRTGLAGQYKVGPATMQEQFFPEVYGRSNGMLFTLVDPAGTSNAPVSPTPIGTPAATP